MVAERCLMGLVLPLLFSVVVAYDASLAPVYQSPNAPQDHIAQYVSAPAAPPAGDCTCATFLVTDSRWLPEYKVFSVGETYSTACNEQLCRDYCMQENSDTQKAFSYFADSKTVMPPNASIPCSLLPSPTALFYSTCDSPWKPLTESVDFHVCCDPLTRLPQWCDFIPETHFQEPEGIFAHLEEGRGLDLDKSPHDIENNEIDSGESSSPIKSTSDYVTSLLFPSKTSSSSPIKSTSVSESSDASSWISMINSYLGAGFSEILQNINLRNLNLKSLMNLPKQVRHIAKTYTEEMGMGRCYMEFTTYSVFTKGENPLEAFGVGNPFEFFTRGKRDTSAQEEREAFSKFFYGIGLEENEETSISDKDISDDTSELAFEGRSSEKKKTQVQQIESLVGSMVSWLEKTETTKNYAKVIKQLLPVVTKVYASDSPTQAVNNLMSLVLGSYFDKSKVSKKQRPKPESTKLMKKKEKLKKKPIIPSPPPIPPKRKTSGQQPIGNMLFSMLSKYAMNYLQGSSSAAAPSNSIDKIDTNDGNTQQLFTPSNLIKLAQMFMGSSSPLQAARPRPSPTKATTTTTTTEKPDTLTKKQDELLKSELERPKDFVDVILEVIRPVFISIIGRAPGDSGVTRIREVSRLSVLGRVDSDLAEEVLSPYFCLKNYMVNKAWGYTERGLRNFVAELTPEEQETFRALIT